MSERRTYFKLSPVELSLLVSANRPFQVPNCPVCDEELAVHTVADGRITYSCPSPAASALLAHETDRRTGTRDASLAAAEHRSRSTITVENYGDTRVVALVAEIREAREAAGEDVTVPEGTVHFPDGHGRDQCWRYVVHEGDDRWREVHDLEYSHNPDCAQLVGATVPPNVPPVRH